MSEDTYRQLQKKAFAICRNAGLSRTDRLDLAREMLGGGIVESFNDLSLKDMEDLCFGLSAWDSIQKIREANGALLHEAQILVAHRTGNLVTEEDSDEDESDDPEAVEAPESPSDTESEAGEAEDFVEPESAHEEAQEEAEDDALSPEIASAFASTRKSRKQRA